MSAVLQRSRKRLLEAVGPSLWDAADRGRAGAAAKPPPASPGLSLAHPYSQSVVSPAPFGVVHVAKNGFVTHLRRLKVGGWRVVAEDVKRGKVKGLSRAAAARCRRLFLSVDQSKVLPSFFGCNTLPQGEFSYAEFKRFVKRWRDRFERAFPGIPCQWVNEFTVKREPHLHFVPIWLKGKPMPTVQQFREWNREAWIACVKSKNPGHRRAGTQLDLCRSYQGAVSYLSGYLAKGADDDVDHETGRMWGCIGRKFLPVDEEQSDLTKPEFYFLQRQLFAQRRKKAAWLHSVSSHDSMRSWGKPVIWKRVRQVLPAELRNGEPPGFVPSVSSMVEWWRSNGFRVRQVKINPFRRRGVKVFDLDERSGKVERRRHVESKIFRKFNPETGAIETEYVDEIESVACAWHYLQSGIVLRLLEFLRRPRGGLTTCEVRWLDDAETVRKREKPLCADLGTMLDDVPF